MAKRNKYGNIRVLSRAYAHGRISREEYVRLRKQQADAIEDGLTPPELPVDVQVERFDEEDTTPTEIALQTVEIAPQLPEPKHQRPVLALVGVLAALVLVLLLDILVFTETEQRPQDVGVSVEVELAAHNLLEKRNWDDTDINEFLDQWLELSTADRDEMRSTLWFGRLSRVTTKRMREIEKLNEITGPSEHTEEMMARLRSLTMALDDEEAP